MNVSTRFWDNIAEKYAGKPVANPDAYQRKLEATRARLRPSDAVLDIGCGTGSLALELAPHVASVHAIDLSAEMIKIARAKAAAARVDNVTFAHVAIEGDVSLAAASFDVVCAYNILHLVDDPQATLDKIFELMKPGATLVSSTSCLREDWVPYGLILPVMRALGKAPAVHLLSVEQLQRAHQAAGLREITTINVSTSKTTCFMMATKPGR